MNDICSSDKCLFWACNPLVRLITAPPSQNYNESYKVKIDKLYFRSWNKYLEKSKTQLYVQVEHLSIMICILDNELFG